ncbi:MAG: hypothetical protein IIV59_04115, partial [Selenomonadaceae bacterium]|nr:hypothetical protein [Selenomonadaceae bacterium]
RRLRSHSLRSEAALKVFFGYMPHLSFFVPDRYKKALNELYHKKYDNSSLASITIELYFDGLIWGRFGL